MEGEGGEDSFGVWREKGMKIALVPLQNLMAIMYKIVEGEPPQLPDHFNPHLRALFGRSAKCKVNGTNFLKAAVWGVYWLL